MKKILSLSCLSLCLVLVQYVPAFAQYKSFKISAKGDTINVIDASGKKQGKWVNRVEELRGEPGYEEEGNYKNGVKNGGWRLYTLDGDLLGIENYKMGGKDGIQQYYTYVGELIREESWRGFDPEHPYDTIPIYGTGNNEIIEFRIVRAEPYSVKQGTWKYYDPGTGMMTRQEEWVLNNIVKGNGSTTASIATTDKKKVEKTPEMVEWERKNKGKKNAIRDGRTGL